MAAANTDERDKSHAALTALLDEGGALHTAPIELERYFDDAACARFAIKYRQHQPHVQQGGKAVVVSAGPPGAGKSTALAGMKLTGYRRIDPDEIKDMLLNDAERHGLLAYRDGFTLPDGGQITPRELAVHVHDASNQIASIVRSMSLSFGENIIVDGTLTWAKLPGEYVEQFVNAGYGSVQVVDVEAPLAVAIERARKRWWEGRTASDPMGGRFMPDWVIRCKYETPDVSVAATYALELAQLAGDELGKGELFRYDVDTTGTVAQTGYKKFEPFP